MAWVKNHLREFLAWYRAAGWFDQLAIGTVILLGLFGSLGLAVVVLGVLLLLDHAYDVTFGRRS